MFTVAISGLFELHVTLSVVLEGVKVAVNVCVFVEVKVNVSLLRDIAVQGMISTCLYLSLCIYTIPLYFGI